MELKAQSSKKYNDDHGFPGGFCFMFAAESNIVYLCRDKVFASLLILTLP